MEKARQAIREDRFGDFKEEIYRSFGSDKGF